MEQSSAYDVGNNTRERENTEHPHRGLAQWFEGVQVPASVQVSHARGG